MLTHAQSTLAICYRVHIVRKQLATACSVYTSNWLPHAQCMLAIFPYAQLTLANFHAQTTLAIATVCAVNASNLLPYEQCTLANCYRMRSIR